ncbi:MAG: 2-succinyl-5-enolpyruvyl-6-hydroxy-3-cyclohexene-1-carboxylic-acid synthase [bacterium]
MGTGNPIKHLAQGQGVWNLTWAGLLVEELTRLGVRHFVLAPGSRSTPLALAVAANKLALATVHIDERGAAYFALGLARATRQAVAVISTSGTAAGNFLPAVMEASNDAIGLIVLTADRPPEKHGVGANQTIAQEGMFADYARGQINLPVPDDQYPLTELLAAIDQGYYAATGDNPGPVHFNCPFRKPLVPAPADCVDLNWPGGLPRSWREGRHPYSAPPPHQPKCSAEALRTLVGAVTSTEQGLVVIGHLPRGEQQSAAARLADHLGWPVVADITSGLRLGRRLHNRVGYFDYICASGHADVIPAPLTVLHLGGRIVSQQVLEFAKRPRVTRYLMVNNPHVIFDPEKAVTERINSDIEGIVDGLCDMLPQKPPTPPAKTLLAASARATAAVNDHLRTMATVSEPDVARVVSEGIRADGAVFLASSMPVRDMNLFAVGDGPEVPVGCNRGVSGIDGTVASAIGFGNGHRCPITVVTGDLALLHDLNSLALVRHSQQPITIIVINNNGGGIFSFLPIEEHHEVFESFFGVPHELTFKSFCKPFDLDYFSPQTPAEFRDTYTRSQEKHNHTLIEVTTDRAANLALHRHLQQLAIEAIANA